MSPPRVLFLSVVVAVAGCKRGPQPPTQPTLDALEKARADGRARDQKRKAVLAAALKDLVPRPDLGPCPVKPELPDRPKGGADFDLERMQRQLTMLLRIQFDHLVRPAELAQEDGPLARHLVGRTLPPSEPDAQRQLDDLRNAAWDWDLVVVEDLQVAAEKSGLGFTGGEFAGLALLYDYQAEKVACMSAVHLQLTTVQYQQLTRSTIAAGRETVSDSFNPSAQVQLVQQALRRALAELSVAGPRT